MTAEPAGWLARCPPSRAGGGAARPDPPGASHPAALRAAYCWGDNTWGQVRAASGLCGFRVHHVCLSRHLPLLGSNASTCSVGRAPATPARSHTPARSWLPPMRLPPWWRPATASPACTQALGTCSALAAPPTLQARADQWAGLCCPWPAALLARHCSACLLRLLPCLCTQATLWGSWGMARSGATPRRSSWQRQ